jgi:GT2 family glycosyltransferase/ubiquinone/menaquinone biosynthesis C-methylase UbiE
MMEKEKQVNVSSSKVFVGSKPKEFYDEGYYLNADGSNYGRKAADGSQLFTPYDEQSYLPRNRQLAKFVCKIYKPKTVMVLGCARGYLVKAFRELGVEAVGVDISKWAIENSPEDVRKHLFVGDICDLSLFESGHFDVTIAFDVFEHITVPDLYTALNEAARVTGKVVLIDVPIEKDDTHPDQSKGTDKSHVSVYSQFFWIRQFKKRGFPVIGKDVYTYPEGAQGATIFFKKQAVFAKPAVVKKKEPVDVIVINYNGLKFTPKCVETLYKNTDYPFNLIVVDNQSTDGSADWLDFAAQSYPNMQVFCHEQLNKGYAEGINAGLKLSKSKYVCLLNNDVIITQKNWLSELVKALEKSPDRGVVSPKLLYPDGRIQYAGATFNAKSQPYHIGRFKHASLFSVEREIPTATFACVLLKREVLGEGLDEAYLLGTFEDTDACTQARFNGYSIWYCPQVVLYHYEGATVFTLAQDHYLVQQQVNAQRFLDRWGEWVRLNMNALPEVYQE